MATRGTRGRRTNPDEDEEAPAPRAATPAAPAGGAASAPARAARTPAPTPGAADADPENITPEFLADFNAKKGEIERVTASVKSSTGLIVSYTQQLQQTSDPGEVANYSKQLAAEVKAASGNAAKGKKLLDKLKAEEDALRRAHPKSARLQPYKAQYMRLCKVYVDVMKDHQSAKERTRTIETETMVRRGKLIYGGTKSEAEIRERVEHDPTGFLQEAIMQEASEEAQSAYADAQSRARDVEMLVRSINEVAQMFQDLAVLVQHQSEMIDHIESNVEQAGHYVRKGNKALRDGIEYQKKSRKWMCCLICVVVVVIIILIAGLGSFFSGAIKTA